MKKLLLAVTAIIFFAAGNVSWAQRGGMMGGGMGGGMMGYGQGSGQMMGPGQGGGQFMGPGQWGYNGNPSQQQPYRSREDFYNATRQLRRDMNAKEDALHRELNSSNPDEAKVNRLRSDLSDMQRELDQQWQNYQNSQPQGAPRSRSWYGGGNWQPQR
jgi:Spy/CpxP family protein refolding chaperone